MAYSLGIAVRASSVLIVTNDFKYENIVLFKPVNDVKLEGEKIRLCAICFGEAEQRQIVHQAIVGSNNNMLDVNHSTDDLLWLMEKHGVELRVITDKSVHVFQNIRGVASHGVVNSTTTTFWFGEAGQRELFYPYCGPEGKPFREAYRDKELTKVFELVHVYDL